MLYLLYGSRAFTKKESIHIKRTLLAKRPDALSLSFSSEDEVDLEELAGSQGLFMSRYIVELDGVFASGQIVDEKRAVDLIKESENIFLVLEEKLPKKTLDLLKKNAEKTSEEKGAVEKKKDFTSFSLSDALANRDKKTLWALYREAVARGKKIEELHGILFWQAKMIVLAHKTSTAAEAGVKQYPYSKAKPATKKYSLREAEELLHALSRAIIEGRRKGTSLEHAIERVILSL
jgi:DNA polymerase III delta subunit